MKRSCPFLNLPLKFCFFSWHELYFLCMLSAFSNCCCEVGVKIPFADIPKIGCQYTVIDDVWLAETELHRILPVQAELMLQRKSDTRVEVQGQLCTEVRFNCDRCLVDYDFAVQTNFHLILEVLEEDSWNIGEMECTKADIDTVQLTESVVDFADILRQQLCLSLPVKKLCSEQCQGLCPQCGTELDTGKCTCSAGAENSPFAVLAALQSKKE